MESLINTHTFRLDNFLAPLPKIPIGTHVETLATPDDLQFILEYVVNNVPLPEAFKWTNLDVKKWIDSIGFPQYRGTFSKNAINGRTLIYCTNPSALTAMNIINFKDLMKICDEIQKLLKIEKIKWSRSISLPPRYPDTHYKFYKTYTGPKYELATRTDLWRLMKICNERKVTKNHWEKLTDWLKHVPYQKEFLIGGRERFNLYEVKKDLRRVVVEKEEEVFECECIPPCERLWNDDMYKKRWQLACLVKRGLVPSGGDSNNAVNLFNFKSLTAI